MPLRKAWALLLNSGSCWIQQPPARRWASDASNQSRGVYAALLILRRYNGVNVQSEFQIAHEAGISDEDHLEAIRLWHIRMEAQANEPDIDN